MVFPSVPAYLQLDPPNWNQPGHQQAIGVSSVGGGGGDPHHLFPPAAPRPEDSMAAAPGLARPASMADRARLAKVPQPEPGLKCPRCESTNTKFCYFNNYSLSQPRHFCKTCRRYWTRGGALRSVPVGGGCRRNKRSKSGGGGSKFSGSSASASSVTSAAASGGVSAMISSSIAPAQPQPPFMASLHNSMADYGAAPAACSIGLGFGGGARHFDAAGSCFQVGGSSGGGLQEQWRLQQQVQQFPFNAQGVMDDDGGGGRFAAQVQGKEPSVAAGLNTHLQDSVKNEEGLHLPRQYLGIASRNDHFWGGGGGGGGTGGSWTDISGAFNSASSCSNIL